MNFNLKYAGFLDSSEESSSFKNLMDHSC